MPKPQRQVCSPAETRLGESGCVIELRDVSKLYEGPDGQPVRAVDGISFEVGEGETVALIGTSGCGKTTTMKLINRLVEPTSGSIFVDNKDVAMWDVIKLRRQIGYVIQRGGLFPHMTVRRNIGLLCELEGWRQKRIVKRVRELLELVNLPPQKFAKRYPSELSGGQQQRVCVARSLVLDPKYILMDEPFGALDPITRAQLHEEFLQLQQRVKKSIVLVTHDMEEAFKLSDRIALMNAGRIVQMGSLDDFRERPANDFVDNFFHAHFDTQEAHA